MKKLMFFCFFICGMIVVCRADCSVEGEKIQPQTGEEIADTVPPEGFPTQEENEKIKMLSDRIQKKQWKRYRWSADDKPGKREKLFAGEDDNAVMCQFYYDLTDSSLQTLQTLYASFPEALPYVIADYNFLCAYREFLVMLRLYADYSQEDYESAVQIEPREENPMAFLWNQVIQNRGDHVFQITTPSGLKHSVKIDHEGYFEILSCELPDLTDDPDRLVYLAYWEWKWKYGSELLRRFPPMSLDELIKNMRRSVQSSSVSFLPRKQSGRYLLKSMRRYCEFEEGRRTRHMVDYTGMIVEATYLPEENRYQLKSKILSSAAPREDVELMYDAETWERISDHSDYDMEFIALMLHTSAVPWEDMTQGQCREVEDMRFELTAVGLSQGNPLALIKTVAMAESGNHFLEGDLLLDLNKGKCIAADYHFVVTTEGRDQSVEVAVCSLDD